MNTRSLLFLGLTAAVGLSSACSSDSTGPGPDAPATPAQLLSVLPAGGATGVSVADSVVLGFDHPLASGMESYAVLHEGSLKGPLVAGGWRRSSDGTRLTFMPTAPLMPSTTYVVHLGGGMMDAEGTVVDLETHGMAMGGQWATASMMSGGMATGGMMSGAWVHPTNGSYGMMFPFSTEKGPEGAIMTSVQPMGGAVNVSSGDSVVVTFNHAIASGMEAYADLHEGSLAGEVVPGTWTRSADGTKLTFVPTAPLKSSTTYMIHLGGGMAAGDGGSVSFDEHGTEMGGVWATQGMMGGGMGGQGTHMGTGWQHPSNGTYGMVFSFTTAAGPAGAALASVHPMGGAVDVAVGDTIALTFDHPIAAGMEAYAALLEGSVTGSEVAGVWSRSEDGTRLLFVPSAPLKAATTYVIHVGGGMMDGDGLPVNLEMHGLEMGGSWATRDMMTGGMGGGMGGQGTHMGTGWQHPSNGTYGMVFTFTTAP